ncbi:MULTISPECIES: long-chain fatty acid--CoA ligase [Rhodococcus]|jgi:long-chain acyl-CoA synthetase|uniref:AMP-dependent synthetase/ligase n=1 Tax=Rhodococcus TaxID=1827 RepID=UPI000BCE9E51|nr:MULTISPECIES: AMP-dependent synthetase/ligase [Rhodococcus]MBP1161956.1 long-chain acyl-CoA synthetase [Rhodococcus sp. PvR099]MCZ4557718.1 AMP-dependent synthetase/ligase [Rhodococcus maanshanensis]PTR43334.1 long-chain acyl-CoA synthetase [Rhodococcus sp. OK611]SNX91197.1 long-chain acyl-CoA synthetase [Rhodococcus sp. OK270]
MTTIPELFQRNADLFHDKPALTHDGVTLTWGEAQLSIARIALGLSRLGVRKGDRVAIMMSSRPEHWLTDQAAVHLGALPATVYGTMPSSQIAYVANHSRARVAVLEGADEVERWLPVLDQLPELEHVVVLDPEACVAGDERFVRWSDVVTEGTDLEAFEAVWREITEDDPVTLIYTSGTTGVPKGVLLTHRNVIANAEARDAAAPTPEHFRSVCYLPLAHIAERMVSVYMIVHKAGHVTFCPDPSRLVEQLVRTRPTSFFGVPRIWEKLAGALRSRPGSSAADVGLDEVLWACSSAAPLSVAVQEYFRSLGVSIVEAWGMTEATGVVTSTSAEDFRFGSVGIPIPGTEIKLLEDGEILVRGPIVSPGYLQEDGSLVSVTDDDGWMHSGDVGRIDEDGHLYIVDRKKDLIITAGGKNIAPAAVEALLTKHPLVGQSLAYGDRRPYLVALIVLDQEAAAAWATSRDIAFATPAELATHPDVIAEIDRAVDLANEDLARVEQVKRYRVLPTEWTPEGGELTASLKIKRRAVHEKYGDVFDALYA